MSTELPDSINSHLPAKILSPSLIYFGALPCIVLAAVIIRLAFRTEGCIMGLVAAFQWFILIGLLFISLLVTALVQVLRILQGIHVKHRVITISICVIVTGMAIGAQFMPRDFFQSNAILVAERLDFTRSSLTLREDGSYTAHEIHIDWGCYYSGEYRMSHDTLFLDPLIVEETDSAFSSVYLRRNEYLLPLDGVSLFTDTTSWLKIHREPELTP